MIPLEGNEGLQDAALRGHGDVLAFVASGGRVAGNFLSATVPLLEHPDVPAVVMPSLAPLKGPVRTLAAAAVQESRLGGGSLYFRFMPGNIRRVNDFPAESLVIRRDAYAALPPRTSLPSICSALAANGTPALYSPETVVVVAPPPLFLPHLRRTASHGRRRGRSLRRSEPGAVRGSAVAGLGLLGFALAAVPAVLLGGMVLGVWLAFGIAYGLTLAASSLVGAARFGSLAVGAVTFVGLVATHAVFTAALVRGLIGRS